MPAAFVHYLKFFGKISSTLLFQGSPSGLNIATVNSTVSVFALAKLPPASFSFFNITDASCISQGRKIYSQELIAFLRWKVAEPLEHLTIHLTSSSILLTLKYGTGPNSKMKTIRMEYEEVPFLLARHAPLEELGCIVTTLPRPWLQAFDMVSAFRFPHDIQIELIHEGEYVRVESAGGSKSRTHIDVAEVYSIQLNVKKTSFMTSLKELRAVFDLAVQISSMANMYYNSSCDEGPLVIQVPSQNGVSLELTCSTLPPESASVDDDDENLQTTKKIVSEDEFVAESAAEGSDIEIPATPTLDYP